MIGEPTRPFSVLLIYPLMAKKVCNYHNSKTELICTEHQLQLLEPESSPVAYFTPRFESSSHSRHPRSFNPSSHFSHLQGLHCASKCLLISTTNIHQLLDNFIL
ncbi:hypothetical protein L3X38_038521 [Prunus dulcis]|uniref:Uncharacterized protein n=1 Tax=Prunus dulcis TaxID=3755 RepID=A0AAD4V5R7_PRUDU|nr:hypothetical protein L3X38_038521 [Prunus dulcis]